MAKYIFFSRAIKRSSSGATMVEVAIMMPLFLLLLFLVIFLGVGYHAKTSITYAVGSAARLAKTRGNDRLIGSEVIDEVQQWQRGGAPSAHLIELLRHNVPDADALDWYRRSSRRLFRRSFQRLRPEYIYAQIYAQQSMLQSMGDSLRYPCDPTRRDGQNCLRCWNLNPSSIAAGGDGWSFPPAPPPAPSFSNNGVNGYNIDFVGVGCQYQPSSAVLGPVQALISFMTGGAATPLITTTRTYYFPQM